MSHRTPTTARYQTVCTDCPDPIAEGDRILLTDTGWAHQHCHTTPPARHESTDVCPDCHEYRALSGACSCPD